MKFVLAVNQFGEQTGKSMQIDKRILSGENRGKDRYKGGKEQQMAKYMKTVVYVQAPSGKVIPESQYKKLSKKARKSWHRTVAWGEWRYSRKEGKYIQIRSYDVAWSAKSKRQIKRNRG